MQLGDFLTDQSLGSWADEMEDMPLPSRDDRNFERRPPLDRMPDRRDMSGQSQSYDRFDRGDGQMRQELPLPDKPPFTAHLGNLNFDSTETDLTEFFAKCSVTTIRLITDRLDNRPKGYGYAEFSTLDGLKSALDMNNSQFAGRNIRVSVAEPPRDQEDDRTTGEWRRSAPVRSLEPMGGDRPRREFSDAPADNKVRDFDNWERKGPLSGASPRQSSSGFRERGMDREPREREFRPRERESEWRGGALGSNRGGERDIAADQGAGATERPRLALQKRSTSSTAPTPVEAAASAATSKQSPFGAAKPIDADARLREIERRAAAQKRSEKWDSKHAAHPKVAGGPNAEETHESKQYSILSREGDDNDNDEEADVSEPPKEEAKEEDEHPQAATAAESATENESAGPEEVKTGDWETVGSPAKQK